MTSGSLVFGGIVVLLALVHVGSSLKCYEYKGISDTDKGMVVECAGGCFKTQDFSTGLFTRGCGIGAIDVCEMYVYETKEVCNCNTELCNGAGRIGFKPFLVAMTSLIGIVIATYF